MQSTVCFPVIQKEKKKKKKTWKTPYVQGLHFPLSPSYRLKKQKSIGGHPVYLMSKTLGPPATLVIKRTRFLHAQLLFPPNDSIIHAWFPSTISTAAKACACVSLFIYLLNFLYAYISMVVQLDRLCALCSKSHLYTTFCRLIPGRKQNITISPHPLFLYIKQSIPFGF